MYSKETCKCKEAAWVVIDVTSGTRMLFEAHLAPVKDSPCGWGWLCTSWDCIDGKWEQCDTAEFWGYNQAYELRDAIKELIPFKHYSAPRIPYDGFEKEIGQVN